MTPTNSADTEIVRRHLDALWRADWDALRRSLAPDAELRLGAGGDPWPSDAAGLYRQVTQAWDFAPGAVLLAGEGGGIVAAEMRLTNGYGWRKIVPGEYCVEAGLVARISLTDSEPFEDR